jgi:hypothetical protein
MISAAFRIALTGIAIRHVRHAGLSAAMRNRRACGIVVTRIGARQRLLLGLAVAIDGREQSAVCGLHIISARAIVVFAAGLDRTLVIHAAHGCISALTRARLVAHGLGVGTTVVIAPAAMAAAVAADAAIAMHRRALLVSIAVCAIWKIAVAVGGACQAVGRGLRSCQIGLRPRVHSRVILVRMSEQFFGIPIACSQAERRRERPQSVEQLGSREAIAIHCR